MAVDTAAACAAIAAAGRAGGMLTVHGTRDAAINCKDARLFHSALPGSGLLLVEGADHNFTGSRGRAELVAAAAAFLSGEGAEAAAAAAAAAAAGSSG